MLRMVHPEVRGVWMDLLCAMMNAEPYGHLAVNGRAMTDQEAARLTGLNIETFIGIRKQIEDAHISSRTPEGMLYCRRLVRDYEKFKQASAYGKKGGGNPALIREEEENREEQRSQKPEAKGAIKVPFIGTHKGNESSNDNSSKLAKPTKLHHGEFQRVLLTAEEHAKLLEAYGDRLPAAIEVLDTYLEAKGRKYRSHYAVMKKHGWVWERVFQGKPDASSKPDAGPARDPEDIQVDRYRAMETYLLKAELRDAEETERLNREFYGDSEREMKWDYAKLVIRRARKALQERGEGAS